MTDDKPYPPGPPEPPRHPLGIPGAGAASGRYTPTTEEMRDRSGKMPHLREQFDRWIAAHDAELLERVARSGLFGTTAQSELLREARQIRKEAGL